MVQMALPSGQILDFGNASDDQIQSALAAIKESDPEQFKQRDVAPDLDTASYEDLRKYYGTSSEDTVQTTHKGEVKDFGLQFFVGRGDTDEERMKRLVTVFGPEGVEKVGPDDFVLNLDNISEEAKEKYNLPSTGTMRFNAPGLGWQDVWSFLGRETVPLTAAIGASVAATGVGFWPGVTLVAAAGAAGKAIDEYIFEDVFEGLQLQSNKEILRDVAVQALIEGSGEGVGRSLIAGGKWLLKGKGPAADSVRVAELRDRYIAQGYRFNKANKLATKAAREEASALYRQMVEEGANIPAVTVTGKSILGRTQAIWESIFPNDAAVAKNVQYVNNILKRYKSGEIGSDEAKSAIARTADTMVAKLEASMADPNQAVKQANKELRTVLEKEFESINKVLEGTTSGSQGLASEVQKGLQLAIGLFQARSAQLYRNADELLGNETISLKPLQDILKTLTATPEGIALQGGDKLTSPLFQYIKQTDSLEIYKIPALRAALRASAEDPNLMGTTAGKNIKKMLDSVDASLAKKEISLTQELDKSLTAATTKTVGVPPSPRSTRPVDLGEGTTIFPSPATVREVPVPRGPSEIDNIRDGINLLKEANKHYQDGAEVLNSGFLKTLNSQIKEKNIVDITEIVNLTVVPKQPNKLKFFLDSLQPSSREINEIIRVGKENPGVFDELAEQIRAGDIAGVNLRLDDLGLGSSALEKAGLKPDKVMLRVPDVFKKMSLDDPMRIRLQNDFGEVLKLYGDMSKAAGAPTKFREGFRELMSKNWLDNAVKLNTSDSGINYSSLASSWDDLGVKLQDELFGSQAKELRKVMQDFKILNADSVSKLNEFSQTLNNQDAGTILSTFKGVVQQAEQENRDAFLRAMAGGPIEINKLVDHILKNPKNFETLRSRVGDELLGLTDDAPLGNFKDLIISRIVRSGFPTGSITDDVVSSGSWANAWAKTINDLNKGGALETILGKETVSDLKKMVKAGDVISDSVMKGKTGLAAAGYSAGFATALIMEPISTLTGAASILTLSRALRSKPIMKYLTNPRLRAYEAERAMKIGADIDPFLRRNLAREKARESAMRSLRTILVDAGYYASDQAANVAEQEIITPVVEQARSSVQDINVPSLASNVAAQTQTVSPLRQIEINKLMTGRP